MNNKIMKNKNTLTKKMKKSNNNILKSLLLTALVCAPCAMAAASNDPFTQMAQEMDRMINEQIQMRNRMFNNAFPVPFGNNNMSTSSISTNVKEDANNYQVDITLKGFNKEDIKADLTRGYLVIRAVHNGEAGSENKNQAGETKSSSKSSFTSQYQQSFYVGENLTKDDIKAKFENDVLSITIPKKPEKKEILPKEAIVIK